ncbi:hypothetical protein GN956_G619 [Arapaima gigas]
MRETFQCCQKLLHDPTKSSEIFTSFSRILDSKGLVVFGCNHYTTCSYCVLFFACFFFKVNPDFILLFGPETSCKLLEKWDTFFNQNIIKEAKNFVLSFDLCHLHTSAENLPE